MIRLLAFSGLLLLVLPVAAQTEASKLWFELQVKRESLASLHQEFDVSQTSKRGTTSQSMKRQIVLDMGLRRWREKSVSGSGNQIRIFDGKDLFRVEEGGNEFLRIKRRAKDEDPVPSPYGAIDAEWAKTVELERRTCGIPGVNHQCVLLQVPLRKWSRAGVPTGRTTMLEGNGRVLLDMETGLIITLRMVQSIQTENSGYQTDVTYQLKRMSYGAPVDVKLFRLPTDGMTEVKEFTHWNAAKIKKELAGRKAPELSATDLQAKPLTLADFKGKTVLLDFWTTWCPPCRADGPALDKLYRKYGEKDLQIIGISVSEERALVEKFLKDHPHSFPIVLTSENEMPKPYQIGVFPTYIVIDREGNITAALEGDQGFADLRKVLKKAGLESE